MYVTYDYYTGTYGGNTIPPERFAYFEREAEVFIDYITFNRIKKMSEVPDEVKMAPCSVMESMYHATDGSGMAPLQLKSSESVGDYQVSYQSSYQTQTPVVSQIESMYYQVAKKYLIHTGLVYRGLDSC